MEKIYYFPNQKYNVDNYWGRSSPVCMDRSTAELDLRNWNESSYDAYVSSFDTYEDEDREPFAPVKFDEFFHEATDAEIEEFGIYELPG